jgi:hypothetical protein
MPGIGQFFLGSAPKVTQEPSTPTTGAAQQGVQGTIAQAIQALLGGGSVGGLSATQAYGQPLTAQLDPTQLAIIQALSPGSAATTGAQNTTNAAQNALLQTLSGQPQNYSQYFQQDVATPLQQTFAQQTIPALKAAFAGSSGGLTSGSNTPAGSGPGQGPGTGYQGAVGQATQNLNQQLQQAMTALSTQAITNASQQQVQGEGLSPSVSASPLSNLLTQYQGVSPVQTTQQSTLTNNYQAYLQQLAQLQQLLGTGSGFSTAGTVAPGNTVVSPGQTGLLSSILGGVSSGAGQGLGQLIGGGGGSAATAALMAALFA